MRQRVDRAATPPIRTVVAAMVATNRHQPDAQWTENTRTFLWAMLDNVDASPEVVGHVDCRQTLCKVSFNPSEGAPLKLEAELERMKYPVRSSVEHRDAGTFVVGYIGRE